MIPNIFGTKIVRIRNTSLNVLYFCKVHDYTARAISVCVLKHNPQANFLLTLLEMMIMTAGNDDNGVNGYISQMMPLLHLFSA